MTATEPNRDERFIDFDRAFAEQPEVTAPVRLRLFGQDWELPGAMPAGIPLFVARLMADGRTESDLSRAETFQLASLAVPKDILDRWLAKGLTIERLGDIVATLIPLYMERLTAGDVPGEADGPAEGTPGVTPSGSSPSGPSSSPTSDASTGSTSTA